MRLITLLTDLGSRDHYLAVLKAEIYKKITDARIIDISNDVSKFNVHEASFLLRNSFHHFPERTFHIIGVNGVQSVKNRFLIFYFKKQFILSPDNGFFKLFTEEDPEAVIEISHNRYNLPDYIRDILVETVHKITTNTPASEIGTATSDYIKLIPYQAAITHSSITGKCEYVDSYGNVITNISEKLFNDVGKGRKFMISLPGEEIKKLSENYTDVKAGDPLALFNSVGRLVIALNGQNAGKMIFPRSFNQSDFSITVEFFE